MYGERVCVHQWSVSLLSLLAAGGEAVGGGGGVSRFSGRTRQKRSAQFHLYAGK